MLTWGGVGAQIYPKNRCELQWSPLMRTQASEDSEVLGDSALDSTFLHADWDRNNMLWSVQPFVLPNQTANTAVTPRFRKTELTRCFSAQPGPWKPVSLGSSVTMPTGEGEWKPVSVPRLLSVLGAGHLHRRAHDTLLLHALRNRFFLRSKDEFFSLLAPSTFST